MEIAGEAFDAGGLGTTATGTAFGGVEGATAGDVADVTTFFAATATLAATLERAEPFAACEEAEFDLGTGEVAAGAAFVGDDGETGGRGTVGDATFVGDGVAFTALGSTTPEDAEPFAEAALWAFAASGVGTAEGVSVNPDTASSRNIPTKDCSRKA